MLFEEIKNKYNDLLDSNTLNKSYTIEQKIVDLLEEFLNQNNITNEQKLWAFWNISDNYALQRKHENTYRNHLRFEEFVRSIQLSHPNYMLMLICDTTQRLSLIEGGNSNYWSNLYYEIMNELKLNDSNYCIYFEALRTALYPRAIVSEMKLAEHAIYKMTYLIEKYKNDSQHLRFKILFYSCLLSLNYSKGISNENILSKSYEIFSLLKVHLNDDKIKDNELFGTYDSWNAKRGYWYQSISIHDYIITLIDTKNYALAYKCYLEIGEEVFASSYFKNKINKLKENL
ncbi:MAG: hypothetical protein M0Q88_09620 [Bacilli bacterium]|nr:hypothetical protein [Bacilli bacterium]